MKGPRKRCDVVAPVGTSIRLGRDSGGAEDFCSGYSTSTSDKMNRVRNAG